MKILITGVCGLVGSHLAEKLLEDHIVVGVDNLSKGTLENIKPFRTHKNFSFHQVDILNQKDFEGVFRTMSFDVVFHMAANSDIASGNAQQDFRDTLSTTLVVLEKCKIRKIKQLVFASSGSVYGDTSDRVDESYCSYPISYYAAAKVSSEAFISAYSSMCGIQSFILRFPNIVGERATHGVIYDFLAQLKRDPKQLRVLGNGKQTKAFMYVKDLVDAMIFVWQNAKDKINIYNIAAEGECSVKFIAESLVKSLGLKTKIIYGKEDRGWNGDCPEYRCDISRLNKLGYKSCTTAKESILRAIEKSK